MAITTNTDYLRQLSLLTPDQFEVAIYPHGRNTEGVMMFGLVVGRFIDESSANSALKLLRESLNRNGPYVARFKAIAHS